MDDKAHVNYGPDVMKRLHHDDTIARIYENKDLKDLLMGRF